MAQSVKRSIFRWIHIVIRSVSISKQAATP